LVVVKNSRFDCLDVRLVGLEYSPKTEPCIRVGGARAPLDLMKRKRHTGEEIIKKLREAAGRNVEEVCRALGVSAATYQRWKSHYGGIKKDALKRLRELE
jgi:transcriptional regulator with PAS, ATPase and Fis domain